MIGRRSLGVVVVVAGLVLATGCVALPPAPYYQYRYDGKVFLTYELRDSGGNIIDQGNGEVTRTYRFSTNRNYVESSGYNYQSHERTERDLASDGFGGQLGEYEWRFYDKTSSWCAECPDVLETSLWLYFPNPPEGPRQGLTFYEQNTHDIVQMPVVEPLAACDDGDAEVYRASGPLSTDPTQTGSVTIANC